ALDRCSSTVLGVTYSVWAMTLFALAPYDTGRQYLNFTEASTDPAGSTGPTSSIGCAPSRRRTTRTTCFVPTTRSRPRAERTHGAGRARRARPASRQKSEARIRLPGALLL